MKSKVTLFITIIFLFSSIACAEVIEDLKFNYIPSDKIHEQQDKITLFKALAETLKSHNLTLVGMEQPFMIDASFVSENLQKVVMIKFGYNIDHPTYKNKILPLGEDYLYHSVTKAGSPYALFFKGFENEEVVTLLSSFKSLSKVDGQEFFRNVVMTVVDTLIPRAHAEEECPEDEQSVLSAITQSGKDYLRLEGLKALGCVVGGFKGAWDATGGLVTGTAHLVKHRKEIASKVWSGASKFMQAMKNFDGDVLRVLRKMYRWENDIPPQTLAEIKCRLVTTLGIGSIATYFTLGAGAPAKISTEIEKLGMTEGFSSRLIPLKHIPGKPFSRRESAIHANP